MRLTQKSVILSEVRRTQSKYLLIINIFKRFFHALRLVKMTIDDFWVTHILSTGIIALLDFHCPAERVFNFAVLDAGDEPVELQALRTAFLIEAVSCHLVGLEGRLVVDM